MYAPALEVTVLAAGGETLFTEIIKPARATGFFAQLVMEKGRESTVTVTMRNDAVVRRAL